MWNWVKFDATKCVQTRLCDNKQEAGDVFNCDLTHYGPWMNWNLTGELILCLAWTTLVQGFVTRSTASILEIWNMEEHQFIKIHLNQLT